MSDEWKTDNPLIPTWSCSIKETCRQLTFLPLRPFKGESKISKLGHQVSLAAITITVHHL